MITNKEKLLTPRIRVIRRLAREISKASVSGLILVHGGGSFGHPLAKQYGINKGYKDSAQILGFARTHGAMVALNKMVVDALIGQGIPAVGLLPSNFIVLKKGRIHTMEKSPLVRFLIMGVVPVLCGDAVIDLDTGFSILSGDQLVTKLALQFEAKRIVIAVDVNGFCDADPKVDGSAKLIQRVTLKELESLRNKAKETKLTDVTGGMRGKMLELVSAVKRDIPVLIVNGKIQNNIRKALEDEKVTGTIISKH